jgi:hypothetical protein
VNANLSEHTGFPLFWLAKKFGGTFYDYSPQWYVDVGFKIVQTMLIQAIIIPVSTLVMGFGLPFAMKLYDSRFTMEVRETR